MVQRCRKLWFSDYDSNVCWHLKNIVILLCSQKFILLIRETFRVWVWAWVSFESTNVIRVWFWVRSQTRSASDQTDWLTDWQPDGRKNGWCQKLLSTRFDFKTGPSDVRLLMQFALNGITIIVPYKCA